MSSAPDRNSVPATASRFAPFTLAAVALVFLAAALAWGNSLAAPFLLDDASSLGENASIRRLWPPAWLNPPGAAGETVGGRPVLNFSFALNHALTGHDVRGYRAGNIFIHALAALTLYGLVRQVVGRGLRRRHGGDSAATPPHRGDAELFALAVALLWLLHPLQTAAVTYVVQRAESLCGLFYLLTLYAFVCGAGPVSDRTHPAVPHALLEISVFFFLL